SHIRSMYHLSSANQRLLDSGTNFQHNSIIEMLLDHSGLSGFISAIDLKGISVYVIKLMIFPYVISKMKGKDDI
ncbi:hypothetical protein WA026_010964, partial [Henosepilachna vigintioctopunctata]